MASRSLSSSLSAHGVLAAICAFALVGLSTLFAPAIADDAADAPPAEAPAEDPLVTAATSFVEAFTQRAFAVFADEGSEDEAKQEEFQRVLGDGLAIEFLGRIMLGGRRDEATPEQLDRYEELFPPYITRIYAEQIDEIAQKDLEVIRAAKRGEKDVFVRTQFIRVVDNEPIAVDWRVRRTSDGQFKVIDVSVRGVSIMLVKRDEFGAVINTLGFDGLLQLMEDKIASPFGGPDVGLSDPTEAE